MLVEKLVKMSNHFGNRPDLVLAGGGNTSAKQGAVLYVKGSGTSLATIRAEEFVRMDRHRLDALFTRRYPEDDKQREELALRDLMEARLPGEEAKRPSVETSLHNLFAQTFVLHLHPALVNGLTCGKEGRKAAQTIFGEDALWVDLCRPGYVLACCCRDAMETYYRRNGKPVELLLLQNHGLFLAADSVEELEDMLERVLALLDEKLQRKPDMRPVDIAAEKIREVTQAITNCFEGKVVCVHENNREAVKFSANRLTVQPLMKPFTPDHIVYCKAYPLYAQSLSELPGAVAAYRAQHGHSPKIWIITDCGFFAVDETQKAAETARVLFNDAIKIAVYTESFGGPLPMTEELTDFIVHWEVEAYRSRQNG